MRLSPLISIRAFHVVPLVSVGLMIPSVGGCRVAGPGVEMSVVSTESVPMETADTASVVGSRSRLRLAGAINETLSFIFTVRPVDGDVEGPRITLTSHPGRAGSIDAATVELFRLHSVVLDHLPGWSIRTVPPALRDRAPLDVLAPVSAPVGGMPAKLRRRETTAFWADVHIPKGTADGVYNFDLELRSGGSIVGRLEVELTVWPIVLPDVCDAPILVELDHRALFEHHVAGSVGAPRRAMNWQEDPRQAECDRILTSTMRLLQTHRLNPVLPYLGPGVTLLAGGGAHWEWKAYDEVVGPFLEGRAFSDRVPLGHWPLPLRGLFASDTGQRSLALGPSDTFVEAFCRQSIEHFRAKGWFDRAYALVDTRPTNDAETRELAGRMASALKRADPTVRTVTHDFPQEVAAVGWVGGERSGRRHDVDTWMPRAQFFDPTAMAQERATGHGTWMAVDRPPFSGSAAIPAPSTSTRILTWQALELGAEVLSVGVCNAWPAANGNVQPRDCAAADPNVLLYPAATFGLDEPVASVRLKHLRRALQDAAYVRLLNEHGLEHVTSTLRRALVRYAGADAYRTHFADGKRNGWVEDDSVFELARRIMASELIESASKTGQGTVAEPGRMGRTTEWRRFMETTGTIDLQVDGSRVRWSGAPPEVRAEIEVHLTLQNNRRVPLSGTIRAVEVPAVWTAAAPIHADEVPPRSARRLVLRATATQVLADESGAIHVPLEFVADNGVVVRETARVAWLVAGAASRSIEVDGDLSDWPLGSTNVAADFRLIAGDPHAGSDGNDLAKPTSKTTTFVQRDRDFVYLAVTCEGTANPRPPSSRRKGIRYDDLIPIDEEDLIEILLDPLNAGTRSPSDLFHIAVKRSGTDLTERGIGTDPPCSERRAWPVDWELATAETPRGWTVEMRLPIAAVEAQAGGSTIWGFNVTRWDAANQEFSTWSGALGNAYDPLSLGNLYLP